MCQIICKRVRSQATGGDLDFTEYSTCSALRFPGRTKYGHLKVGVEQDFVIHQEFLIPGVLGGYLECIHFSELIGV